MSLLRNIQNNSYWNIGFCDLTPEQLIADKCLPKIQWMKHPYKDRFFADPFILNITETEIIVFVEEYVFDNPPGLIVELVLDRKTKKLKQRYELLRLPTHLSYPAIIRKGNEIYVYPENGASCRLNLYQYDAELHKLVNPKCIHEDSLFDSTIYVRPNGNTLMVATKHPNNLENAYLFMGASITGPFKQIGELPFQPYRSCARMAGDFFEAYGSLYRPAQDCTRRYGSAISIMNFDVHTSQERLAFQLKPHDYDYNLGLHTINFHNGLCVVDGYGYLYPTLGRIYASRPMATLKDIAKSLLRL
jgi:hypothetical protein